MEPGKSDAAEPHSRFHYSGGECFSAGPSASSHAESRSEMGRLHLQVQPRRHDAQVFQNDKVVGSILTMNGDQKILPLPGADSEEMTKSFEDYKAFYARSHSADSGGTSASSAAAPAAQPAAPATTPTTCDAGPPLAFIHSRPKPHGRAIRFDDANHSIVVPRPDSITVTFVGYDVKIAGYRKLNYIVRHQKGTAGRFLERNLAHSDSTGASISGGGAEFLVEGGGIIYDSSIGTNRDMQVNSPMLT